MIDKSVRRFLARRSVASNAGEGINGDGNIISAGKVYIEIRPGSGIIRPEKGSVATFGLDLETVKEHGGIKKYFDELDSVPFKDTKYFEEYKKFWEEGVQQKLKDIRNSLKELNNFSQMVGKPQYALREINPGTPFYEEEIKHDFETEEE